MYLAELHGKLSSNAERKEDILTSNVFSFFKYADRKVYLKQLITLLGIEANDNDLETADFVFWPNYDDHTQPDLVTVVGIITYYGKQNIFQISEGRKIKPKHK